MRAADPPAADKAEGQASLAASVAMRGLARSAVWNATGFGVVGSVNVFLVAFALRHVTVGEYGAFALAGSATSLLTLLGFGLSMSVVRAVAMEETSAEQHVRDRARRDIATAHAAYVALGAVAMLAAIVLVMLLPHFIRVVDSGQTVLADSLLLIGAANAVTIGTSALPGVARGRRNFRLIAMATIAGAALNAIVTVGTISRLGILALAVATLAASALTPLILAVWIWRDVHWFRFRPIRPRWVDVRPVLGYAAPLLAISVASRVVTATDALVLGVLATTAVVALYRVGAVVPNGLISLLFTGYDVAFPALAGSTGARTQEDVCAFLTRVFGFLAGLVFCLVALFRRDIVQVLMGRPSELAATILMLFCVVWVINASVHGVSLLLIARARQRRFAGLIAAEAVANLVLTVVLVLLVGPLGAVLATVVTMAVSMWVIFPLLVHGELERGAVSIVFKHGIMSSVVGAALAALVFLATDRLVEPRFHLLAAGAMAVVITAGAGLALLRSADGHLIRAAFARDARREVLS
jgi:O-antigen/teichoic acid export membrane protein